MAGRPWTTRELDTLRRHYKRRPTVAIARKLRRTVRSCWLKARDLDLVHRHEPMTTTRLATLHRMARAGYCNRCIGRTIRAERHSVARWRRKLGCPVQSGGAVGTCRTCIARVRQQVARDCQTWGVKSLAEIRSAAFRRYAASHGWPADLRPRAVQILDLLYSRGPMTRRQLCDALDLPWRGSRASLKSNDPEGSYLAHLMRRGLVVCLGRVVPGIIGKNGTRQGSNQRLYALPVNVAPNIAPNIPPSTTSTRERTRCG